MPLSDAQIDRYSRQIIVSEIGGRGQERLLASRLLLAGEFQDIETPLRYAVGAGVGTIYVHAATDAAGAAAAIAEMRELNPDAKVSLAGDLAQEAELVMIVAGSERSLDGARRFAGVPRSAALIVARLDSPGRMAVLKESPPCPACADEQLLAPLRSRAENAGFIAMLATTEALKLLAGLAIPAPVIVEFDGLESKRSAARGVAGAAQCGCLRGGAQSGRR